VTSSSSSSSSSSSDSLLVPLLEGSDSMKAIRPRSDESICTALFDDSRLDRTVVDPFRARCIDTRLSFFLWILSGGPSSATRSWAVVSPRTMHKSGASFLTRFTCPRSKTFASSISLGKCSLREPWGAGIRSGDRRTLDGISSENSLPRTEGQDSPMNMHKLVAAPVALLERRETIDAHPVEGDHRPSCSGKENAIPGYERTYVPLGTAWVGSGLSAAFFSLDGGMYSPGVAGPKTL
jgi:hypothetical protein